MAVEAGAGASLGSVRPGRISGVGWEGVGPLKWDHWSGNCVPGREWAAGVKVERVVCIMYGCMHVHTIPRGRVIGEAVAQESATDGAICREQQPGTTHYIEMATTPSNRGIDASLPRPRGHLPPPARQ